jgi:hypothetical protein
MFALGLIELHRPERSRLDTAGGASARVAMKSTTDDRAIDYRRRFL